MRNRSLSDAAISDLNAPLPPAHPDLLPDKKRIDHGAASDS